MSGSSGSNQLSQGCSQVSEEPSPNNAPSAAIHHSPITQPDDDDDFYETPLTAGTLVQSNVATVPPLFDDVNTQFTTSRKPASLIPGLTLCNESIRSSKDANPSATPCVSENHKDTSAKQISDVSGEDAHSMTFSSRMKDTETWNILPEGSSVMEIERSVNRSEDKVADLDDVMNAGLLQTQELAGANNTPENHLAGEEEHPEWETDSSFVTSSTSEYSADIFDDSDEEDDDYPILTAEEQVRILMQGEAGSDDEGEGKGNLGRWQVKTTNEQSEETLPIPDIPVTPDMKIVLLGHVETIVEHIVLIKASVSGEYQVLESNSMLCLEDRTVIGVVSETLGRVEQPLYAVRFQEPDKIEQFDLSYGKAIFYVEKHSLFVFTQPLRSVKGSDASNFHDEEVGEEEIEFSDDEAEAEYRRKLKQKHKEKKGIKNENTSFGKSKKEPLGASNLGQTVLNYDDEGEEGYTPLTRPKNFHKLIGNQEPPVEDADHTHRKFGGAKGRSRGTGRGTGRGRGGRGGLWDLRHRIQSPHTHQQDSRGRVDHSGSPVDSQASPSNYSQAAHQGNQLPSQNVPLQFPPYMACGQLQQLQQTTYPQIPPLSQFPFQVPYQQQSPSPQIPPGAHVNPAFLAMLQQPRLQQHRQQTHQGQSQAHTAYDRAKAQLDILRQPSGGSGGSGAPGESGLR